MSGRKIRIIRLKQATINLQKKELVFGITAIYISGQSESKHAN